MATANPTGRERIQSVHSFDVFDTLLVRDVVPPVGIFLLVGNAARQRGLITLGGAAFASQREEAERRAFLVHQHRYNLQSIYDELVRGADWLRCEAAALIQLELEIEAVSLQPVDGGRALVEAARQAGHQISFVSDIYLPATFMREQLANHGLFRDGDSLFISCEHGECKASGRLFSVMYEKLGVPASAVVHHGNDLRIDVRGARRAGVKAEWITAGNANRYEAILARHASQTGGFSALVAGASRLTRLSIDAGNDYEAALRDVTAGVVAPIAAAYVTWLFAQSKKHGVKRLYFLARDGRLLESLAARLALTSNADVEVRYLFASRVAWNTETRGPDEKTSLLRDYLEQEGVISDEQTAIVDFGWRGNLHRALVEVLCPGEREPLGFYFGLLENTRPATRFAYLFDGGSNGHYKDAIWLWATAVLESFFVAEHGSLLGYKRQGDRVEPVLTRDVNQAVMNWGFPLVLNTVERFGANLDLIREGIDVDADLRPVIVELLRKFCGRPTGDEARAWGAFPKELGQGDDASVHPLASPYTLADMARTIATGRIVRRHEDVWIEGSIEISPPPIRMAMRMINRYGRKLRRRS